MAQVVETPDPVVREERVEHIHDSSPRRSGAGVVVAIIIILLILAAIFWWWQPWGGSSGGGTTNVNVSAPSAGTNQ